MRRPRGTLGTPLCGAAGSTGGGDHVRSSDGGGAADGPRRCLGGCGRLGGGGPLSGLRRGDDRGVLARHPTVAVRRPRRPCRGIVLRGVGQVPPASRPHAGPLAWTLCTGLVWLALLTCGGLTGLGFSLRRLLSRARDWFTRHASLTRCPVLNIALSPRDLTGTFRLPDLQSAIVARPPRGAGHQLRSLEPARRRFFTIRGGSDSPRDRGFHAQRVDTHPDHAVVEPRINKTRFDSQRVGLAMPKQPKPSPDNQPSTPTTRSRREELAAQHARDARDRLIRLGGSASPSQSPRSPSSSSPASGSPPRHQAARRPPPPRPPAQPPPALTPGPSASVGRTRHTRRRLPRLHVPLLRPV